MRIEESRNLVPSSSKPGVAGQGSSEYTRRGGESGRGKLNRGGRLCFCEKNENPSFILCTMQIAELGVRDKYTIQRCT
jgi:hypothetical protein